MTPALLLLAAGLAAWPSPAHAVARRLARLTGSARSRRPPLRVDERTRRVALAAGLGLGVAVLLGGALGAPAGLAAAVIGERLMRRRDAAAANGPILLGDLPAACDLLAVCVSAGVPLPAALAEVAAAVPGPLGTELERVARSRRLGADPRRAWADVPPELGPLARTVQRAETSGARAAPALHGLAAELRAAQRAAADAAVRRAGVWVLAPLGACFLPAFVCLGVVPLVLGIAGEALG